MLSFDSISPSPFLLFPFSTSKEFLILPFSTSLHPIYLENTPIRLFIQTIPPKHSCQAGNYSVLPNLTITSLSSPYSTSQHIDMTNGIFETLSLLGFQNTKPICFFPLFCWLLFFQSPLLGSLPTAQC